MQNPIFLQYEYPEIYIIYTMSKVDLGRTGTGVMCWKYTVMYYHGITRTVTVRTVRTYVRVNPRMAISKCHAGPPRRQPEPRRLPHAPGAIHYSIIIHNLLYIFSLIYP